ncbi:glycoside hydrolase family 3 N-terminal domain-containing protein [Poseidonocella sp. HB161398]|uniref:glycoside hydrolase family 3 N-terminal domain-containing protein n=1 Tax=Poseidonocella sp. HB161398 TaxID=2320855 RepID=UPI001108C524|nr:glycoside hydrolase family 3 N-terminal domain-containing protein [Poseidonocella sp. HB161398]
MTTQDDLQGLLSRMTLAEKIGQLNLLAAGEGLTTGAETSTPLAKRLDAGEVGAIFGTKSRASTRAMQERAIAGSRHAIPLFFAEDVIHGHRTIFPLNIAQACSWDMELIRACAAFSAEEASSEGLHQVYAPMIDISRDPRWGRVAESPGEDPHLASCIAEAMTRGLQENNGGRVSACLKHFVAYGATQSGRDYDNATMAWEDLLDIYLPPFEAGVKAGAEGVMASFNAVNKMPMHAHEPLIEGWLRRTAGFGGLVVSDYTGVKELVAHGLGSAEMVVARALHAGIDMDMVGEDYLRHLPGLAEHGLDAPETGLFISAETIRGLIDRACLRVLAFKAQQGLFEDPFKGMDPLAPTPNRQAGRALARKAAAGSCVLLKNNHLLPLKPGQKVALIGPLGSDRANMLGTWSVSGDARDVVSLEDALKAHDWASLKTAVGANLVREKWLVDRLNVHGVTVEPDPRDEAALLREAREVAEAADVVILALGEAKEQAGESSSVLCPDLPEPQRRLVAELAAGCTPVVGVIFAGRPLALGKVPEQVDALIYAWHGGVAGPEGVADILTGAAEPTGRLAVTLPVHPGETPLSYAAEPTGRPFPGHFQKFLTGWLDLEDGAARAAYPFGYGLSYGNVEYSAPMADVPGGGEAGMAEISVDITNTSERAVTETVQLYLSDPEARITRPGRLLKDFRRVPVAPGETRRVTFEITAEMLSYHVAPSLAEAQKVWDPGRIIVHTGPDSRATKSVEITWGA